MCVFVCIDVCVCMHVCELVFRCLGGVGWAWVNGCVGLWLHGVGVELLPACLVGVGVVPTACLVGYFKL